MAKQEKRLVKETRQGMQKQLGEDHLEITHRSVG
jgi:hypothetical protein